MRLKFKTTTNDQVKVRLTAKGERQFNKWHRHLKLDPRPYKKRCFNAKTKVWTFQIWELMNIFGPKTYHGSDQMFVDNKLTIVNW